MSLISQCFASAASGVAYLGGAVSDLWRTGEGSTDAPSEQVGESSTFAKIVPLAPVLMAADCSTMPVSATTTLEVLALGTAGFFGVRSWLRSRAGDPSRQAKVVDRVLDQVLSGKMRLNPERAGTLLVNAMELASRDAGAFARLLIAVNRARAAMSPTRQPEGLTSSATTMNLAEVSPEFMDGTLTLLYALAGGTQRRLTQDEIQDLLGPILGRLGYAQEIQTRIYDGNSWNESAPTRLALTGNWIRSITDNEASEYEAWRAYSLMFMLYDPVWYLHPGRYGISLANLRGDILARLTNRLRARDARLSARADDWGHGRQAHAW